MNKNEENNNKHEEPPHYSNEEKIRVVIDPHAEKMENQLYPLLH